MRSITTNFQLRIRKIEILVTTYVLHVLFCLFCWVILFLIPKIQLFSEVTSVACCLFAQYSKDGLLPSMAGSSIAATIITREDGWFSRNNPLSYAGPSSIATKYKSDHCLETCCITKLPLHVTFLPWSLYKQQPQQYDTGHI